MNERAISAAVRRHAGVFDRSAEGRLEVSGADRATWLQGLLTNDVVAIAAGQGCYAAYLTPQGRMIADVRVLALADRLLLDVPRGAAANLQERFDRLVIMEDVVVRDVSAPVTRLAVHGPDAADVVAAALGDRRPAGEPAQAGGADRTVAERLRAMEEHDSMVLRHDPGTTPNGSADAPVVSPLGAWGQVIVAASDDLALPGYDVYVPSSQGPRVQAALVAAGAVAMDETTWQQLRVEAGRPWFGLDMTDDTIPLEAGIEDRAISFTKGCYVGQEIIVRVRDRGHGRVARRLVGLLAPADTVDVSSTPPGARLFAGSREVGHLTSVAWSPTLSRVIALGYLHRDFVDTGTAVDAEGPGGRVSLAVAPLPFVDGLAGARA